ncbi:MAG: hypothetical protein H8D67_19920 [Deltaproteobacteria bacterium]|nr:hypothetical protein [Deltaproteobacteria bacterium]
MKSQDFDKIYKNVPQDQKEMLKEFRASHPYKELDINGSCWRYISCGHGSKTLLFLPGGFAKADMWFYSILALEKDYRIIAPDAYTLQGTFAMGDVCCAILEIQGSFVFKPEVLQSWPGKILILSSKDDKLSIVSIEELKVRYPRAKMHIFEQGGHHTFSLFPEEYSSVIRDFLKKE